ncbi:ubiquitin ligase of SCF [Scheffersomyces amazonensis]|uniref:ubiquitin ligase of SCF n=1 Tax=Scheffersomyces amazonensis TaxID=1078765 RepID=UPI00315CB731
MAALPPSADFKKTWNFVQPGLDFILGTNDEQEGVTAVMYMSCYTAIYNYCINKSRSVSLIPSIIGGNRSSDSNNSYVLPGAELYNKLDKYLTKVLKDVLSEKHDNLLEFYVKKWTRYTIGARYLSNVFEYMNRHWVQKERQDGRRDVYDVNTLCLMKWREEVFKPNEKQLIGQVLELIKKQRDNEIVDTYLISTAVKSLVFLGIDVQDLKKPNLVVYINSFEKKFLTETTEYYQKESSDFLAKNNVVDYMQKCETRLNEEVLRSNNFLEEHTKKHLLETLNKSLIEDHAQEMHDYFISLIKQNELDHILRMYKLLSRVPKCLDPLALSLENYIIQQADEKFKELKSESEKLVEDQSKVKSKPKRGVTNVDTKTYIHTLIAHHDKYQGVVFKAFANDPKFIKALDNASRHFVNKNIIASPTERSKCRTPELLAKYADTFLKKGGKDVDTMDMTADNLMIVFKFLNDKDQFENYYRRQLAKRLITDTSKSEELEESLLQRLQVENSSEYTSKMTRMFADMKTSADLKSNIRDFGPVKDFNPLILAQNMWPFDYKEEYNLKVAPQLEEQFNKVLEYHDNKYNGRQLKWLWHHGRAELKANLSKKSQKFTFIVSNPQLMILMAFNEKSSYTFEELHEIVGGSKNVFEMHLQPFVTYKLLIQTPEGESAMGKEDTSFKIVEDYKSKKLRVNFVGAIKSIETKEEEDEINKEVDETRKNFLSACIVRIMKSRKTIKHNDLVNEVLPQTVSRFQARVIDVKKAIDYLIDKDYMKRLENNTYQYIS